MFLGGDGGDGCRGGSRGLFQQGPVGHRHAVRRTARLLGRQGVRGRHVRRSRKRAPGQPLLGDARLRGRKLLRRPHRRLHDGGRPRHGRGVRVRPPVPAAAALQPERVLRHVRGRGQRRSGRHLHGDRRLSFGPVVRREPPVRRAEARVPAVRGRDVHRRRRVPRRTSRCPAPGKPPADFYRLPFPNDIRVSGGALDISDFPKPGPTPLGVDLVKLYVDTWTADFDGFSAAAGIAFRFSGNIDYNSATARRRQDVST